MTARVKRKSFLVNLDDAFYADVGRVIVAWSNVEHRFDVLLFSLIRSATPKEVSYRSPEVVRVMGQTFNKRAQETRRRVTALPAPPATIARVLNIVDRLERARDERDEVAHSAMQATALTSEATGAFKSWKSLKPYIDIRFTPSKLQRIYERMRRLWDDLADLVLDLNLHPYLVPRPSLRIQSGR